MWLIKAQFCFSFFMQTHRKFSVFIIDMCRCGIKLPRILHVITRRERSCTLCAQHETAAFFTFSPRKVAHLWVYVFFSLSSSSTAAACVFFFIKMKISWTCSSRAKVIFFLSLLNSFIFFSFTLVHRSPIIVMLHEYAI